MIFLTGRADEPSLLDAFEVGAADYVVKPFEPRVLLARVRAHFELALLSRARAALNAGRYDEALAIASEHAQQFPSGVLAPERRAVASRARCRMAAAERGDEEAVRACP